MVVVVRVRVVEVEYVALAGVLASFFYSSSSSSSSSSSLRCVLLYFYGVCVLSIVRLLSLGRELYAVLIL